MKASIPVDLQNPGQVFACLGFLETAEVLCGDAMGRFDWSSPTAVKFELDAAGDENPFAVVLKFLASAKVVRIVPIGYDCDDAQSESHDCFPNGEHENDKIFPISLRLDGRDIALTHWADASQRPARENYKLFAGKQAGHELAAALLAGEPDRSDVVIPGVKGLWERQADTLIKSPFDACVPVQKTLYLDPRRNWDAMQLGFSPKDLCTLRSSPVVDVLASCGLEHARPRSDRTGRVTYGVWTDWLPALLARVALEAVEGVFCDRRFSFRFGRSGRNSFVTMSQEEKSR